MVLISDAIMTEYKDRMVVREGRFSNAAAQRDPFLKVYSGFDEVAAHYGIIYKFLPAMLKDMGVKKEDTEQLADHLVMMAHAAIATEYRLFKKEFAEQRCLKAIFSFFRYGDENYIRRKYQEDTVGRAHLISTEELRQAITGVG
jgi:hypothetical protein